MFERLWAFAPAICVFVGALFVAGGGFWASYRQSHFNAAITEKNEQIIQLQQTNMNAITGGSSFARVLFRILRPDGSLLNAKDPRDRVMLNPIVVNSGSYPLYDLAVRFGALKAGALTDLNKAMISYPIGNLGAGQALTTNITLADQGQDIAYSIIFSARNGIWNEQLRMHWLGPENGYANAIKVMRGTEELFTEVSDRYPRLADGSVDWNTGTAQNEK